MTAFNNKLDVGSKTEWITPSFIIDALGGPFDLDPCAPVIPPYKLAEQTFNVLSDGLKNKWPKDAFTYLNPPYDKNLNLWLKHLKNHSGGGIALIFARTDTKYFRDYVWTADAILFLHGRISFLHVDGRMAEKNSGAPSVLVAYGQRAVDALKHCGLAGQFVDLAANRKVARRLVDVAPIILNAERTLLGVEYSDASGQHWESATDVACNFCELPDSIGWISPPGLLPY